MEEKVDVIKSQIQRMGMGKTMASSKVNQQRMGIFISGVWGSGRK